MAQISLSANSNKVGGPRGELRIPRAESPYPRGQDQPVLDLQTGEIPQSRVNPHPDGDRRRREHDHKCRDNVTRPLWRRRAHALGAIIHRVHGRVRVGYRVQSPESRGPMPVIKRQGLAASGHAGTAKGNIPPLF